MSTKTNKLLNTLSDGKEYTAAQLEKKTKLANVSSTIHRLREMDYEIYTNKRNTKNGVVQKYRWNV